MTCYVYDLTSIYQAWFALMDSRETDDIFS